MFIPHWAGEVDLRSKRRAWFAAGFYLFAAFLVGSSVLDLVTATWPVRLGDVTWRYSLVGLTAGVLSTPMLGLVIAIATAIWSENPVVLRLLVWVSFAIAGLLVVAGASFALDTITVRAMRPPEAQSLILMGSLIQEARLIVAAFVAFLLGAGCLKGPFHLQDRPEKKPPVVVSNLGAKS